MGVASPPNPAQACEQLTMPDDFELHKELLRGEV